VVPSSKLRIEYVPISQLKKNPHNARSHSPGQIAKLKASVRTFGFVVPVLADEQDMLHARVTAAEQLGFRKVIDSTFMIATIVNGNPDPEDLKKFFRALKRAQRDIDLRPDLYMHYYKKEFPARWLPIMDTRRWGPGERLVFEPYTKEAYEESFEWIARHQIFANGDMGTGQYETSVMTLAS